MYAWACAAADRRSCNRTRASVYGGYNTDMRATVAWSLDQFPATQLSARATVRASNGHRTQLCMSNCRACSCCPSNCLYTYFSTDQYHKLRSAITIVSTIIFKLLLIQVYDIGADIVKETLVMWYYQKRLLPILQVTSNAMHNAQTQAA